MWMVTVRGRTLQSKVDAVIAARAVACWAGDPPITSKRPLAARAEGASAPKQAVTSKMRSARRIALTESGRARLAPIPGSGRAGRGTGGRRLPAPGEGFSGLRCVEMNRPSMSSQLETIETDVPKRLDRLPWSRWHWLVVAVRAGAHWSPRYSFHGDA